VVGNFVQGFTVTSFWAGFFGAFLYSLFSAALMSLIKPRA
jgi:uncharacterized membrane protein YvlD (DUF360 family)